MPISQECFPKMDCQEAASAKWDWRTLYRERIKGGPTNPRLTNDQNSQMIFYFVFSTVSNNMLCAGDRAWSKSSQHQWGAAEDTKKQDTLGNRNFLTLWWQLLGRVCLCTHALTALSLCALISSTHMILSLSCWFPGLWTFTEKAWQSPASKGAYLYQQFEGYSLRSHGVTSWGIQLCCIESHEAETREGCCSTLYPDGLHI